MKITAPRVFMGVLLLFVVTVLTFMLIIPSLGFFKVEFDRHGLNTAKIELIFDRLNFDSETAITVNGTATTVGAQLDALGYDKDAVWGSESNPYVISQKYHVQNLSVLQNNGFFKERVKTDPTTGEPVLGDDGKPIPDQSFFLVCTPDGLPVAIDCDGMTIAPIGTHDRPFTGNIQGALFDGSTTYGSYGTSVSTIGDLTVSANTNEPDIGFFGYIGYYGTATTDAATGNPVITGGYAANISNLLLADVTVEANFSITQAVVDWFASILGATADAPHPHTTNQEETHHVGIVAGHAEFATIKDISVFYSSNSVQSFSLAGSSNTSYYSITGLVGMLEHVNPLAQGGNLIGGAGNSVSDGDMLVEGGFGGGGSISGSLTGYMMAETLYNEHEETIQENDFDSLVSDSIGDAPLPAIHTNGVYDVTEMWKHNPKYTTTGTEDKYIKLFETISMAERERAYEGFQEVPWKYYDYYVFKDSVFTFAMSSSSKDTSAVDYVQKIWKTPENATLSATKENADWTYTTDPNPKNLRIAYKFTAIKDASEHVAGGYYVLAYQYKNGTENDWTDDTLYLLTLNNTCVSGQEEAQAMYYNVSTPLNVSSFCSNDGTSGATPSFFENTSDISSFRLVSTSELFHNYAYTIKAADDGSTRTFTSPFADIGTSLALEASRDNTSSAYRQPKVTMSNKTASTDGTNVAYIYDWNIQESANNNNKFAVYKAYSFYGWQVFWGYYTKGTFTFDFNTSTKQFEYRREQATQNTNSSAPTINLTQAQAADPEAGTAAVEGDFIFTIYKVEANTVSEGGGVTVHPDNINLTPKNLFPESESKISYTFNPSQYVLEQQFELDAQGNKDYSKPILDANGKITYALAPIRSYNLNSGRGTYLSQLNHIVKLFKPTSGNNQVSWSPNSLIGSLFGDQFDTNNGGVVGTEIGTTGKYVTIPTGMISFYITEASAAKPSYINIIVAVNPGQTSNGRVGLWYQADRNSNNQSTFSLTNPDQYFDLPISKVAANNDVDGDRLNILTISNYKTPRLDENGNAVLDNKTGQPLYDTYADTNGAPLTSYVHLGGEVAFVYHSFEITTPGTYFLGSGNGSMSVAYFSVSGAAGTGADGSSASPLGNIDFVYANGGKIVTVNQKFSDLQDTTNEDYTLYYPSYHFVLMIPRDEQTGTVTKIQNESIRIYRYIGDAGPTGTKRRIKIIGCTNAKPKGLADMYEDILETS